MCVEQRGAPSWGAYTTYTFPRRSPSLTQHQAGDPDQDEKLSSRRVQHHHGPRSSALLPPDVFSTCSGCTPTRNARTFSVTAMTAGPKRAAAWAARVRFHEQENGFCEHSSPTLMATFSNCCVYGAGPAVCGAGRGTAQGQT